MYLTAAPIVKRGSVDPQGAVLLGTNVVADGFAPRRLLRVVTHAHYDHTRELRKSMAYQSEIAMSPETFAFVKRLRVARIVPSKVKLVRPGDALKVPSKERCGGYEVVRFYRAEHIPGSLQVVVEEPNGLRVGYTGDFKSPGSGTEILRDLDILIIDVTYGCIECVRWYKHEMEEHLISTIKYLLESGPVHVYAYHGKIQEVMKLIRVYGLDVPFLVDNKTYLILKDLEALGYEFGDYVLEGSEEGEEVKRSGWYVRFSHFKAFQRERVEGNKVLLDGWRFRPSIKVGKNAWVVGFSDHADREDIEFYISEANPKLIIADAYRSPRGAKELVSRLRTLGYEDAYYTPAI